LSKFQEPTLGTNLARMLAKFKRWWIEQSIFFSWNDA